MTSDSKPAFLETLKRLLLSLAVLTAIGSGYRALVSVTSPSIYGKDFLSGYLLAKAMATGTNPYLPLPELASLWLPGHDKTGLTHPTPHPFAIGWLCLPLVRLSYENAARVWLAFEVACLGLAVAMFFRVLDLKITWRYWALATFLALGWVPILLDLWYGQFNLLLLVLFLGAWLYLRARRDILGGALLGSLVVLKFVGWPVVLWLAWRRRWSAVGIAITTFAFAHLLAIYIHGWAMLRDYYQRVAPQVDSIYRQLDSNFSAWTLGQRLFSDFGFNFLVRPLAHLPLLASTINLLAPLIILAFALGLAERARSFDTAFAVLAVAGIVLNPIAWTYYLVLTSLVWVLLFRRLYLLRWPRNFRYRVLLVLMAVSITQPVYTRLAVLFASGVDATGKAIVPAVPALFTIVPLLAVCASVWLLARLERVASEAENAHSTISPATRVT